MSSEALIMSAEYDVPVSYELPVPRASDQWYEYGAVPPDTELDQVHVTQRGTSVGPTMLTVSPGFTYTLLKPVTPADVACTEALPTATPVACPEELTVKVPALVLLHVGV